MTVQPASCHPDSDSDVTTSPFVCCLLISASPAMCTVLVIPGFNSDLNVANYHVPTDDPEKRPLPKFKRKQRKPA